MRFGVSFLGVSFLGVSFFGVSFLKSDERWIEKTTNKNGTACQPYSRNVHEARHESRRGKTVKAHVKTSERGLELKSHRDRGKCWHTSRRSILTSSHRVSTTTPNLQSVATNYARWGTLSTAQPALSGCCASRPMDGGSQPVCTHQHRWSRLQRD